MTVNCPRWKDERVAVICSGPSLTKEDCDLVRDSGLKTIVTNTTFRLCHWADALFGFDVRWWDEYHKEVKEVFSGRLFTYSNHARKYDIESLYDEAWFTGHSNSGTCALSLAIAAGAKEIILIGADCQKTDGKIHWHGDHPKVMSSDWGKKNYPQGMSNAQSMKKWPAQFKAIAMQAEIAGVRILNASRQTALTCFDRARLEDVL
jgi:hypothetical protein